MEKKIPYFSIGLVKTVLVNYCYWTAQNAGYFMVVYPNHDTKDIHNNIKNLKQGGNDWGIQQVLSSGNHSCSDYIKDKIITQLWGGMNYQIEQYLIYITQIYQRL